MAGQAGQTRETQLQLSPRQEVPRAGAKKAVVDTHLNVWKELPVFRSCGDLIPGPQQERRDTHGFLSEVWTQSTFTRFEGTRWQVASFRSCLCHYFVVMGKFLCAQFPHLLNGDDGLPTPWGYRESKLPSSVQNSALHVVSCSVSCEWYCYSFGKSPNEE